MSNKNGKTSLIPNSLNNNGFKLKKRGGGGNRLYWIDLLKGITILGVIWVHAGGHPEWLTASTVNTLFFFMAGMFFKQRPFVIFVKRHVWSLVIPFLMFYLLAYPFRSIVELWDYRQLDAVTWSMIFDVFKIEGRSDYLYSNVPLWFLLCLFWVQLFYWMISRLPLWGKLLIFTGIWIFWDALMNLPSPLMINNALCWLLYFGMGQISYEVIMRIVRNRHTAVSLLLVSIVVMLISHIISDSSMAVNLFYMAWCLTMVIVASFFDGAQYTKWIEFFGVNSLVILGAHLWFLTPIMRIFQKLNGGNDILTSIIGSILCALLLIPTIVFINKYLPILAGKRKSIKATADTQK